MYTQCKQDDETALIDEAENEIFINVERSTHENELSFSWFLIKILQQIRKLCPPNYALFKHENLSYYAQLLLVFIIFFVAILIGAVFLNDCSQERMICIFLIVHGSCGMVIVLIHIISAFLNRQFGLCESRNLSVKCIFSFAHSLVVFSMIWYVIGHIWVFQNTTNKVCMTKASRTVIILLVLEYLIAFWYICSRIWNLSLVLSYLQQIIQQRLKKLPIGDQGPRLRIFENTDSPNDEIDQPQVEEIIIKNNETASSTSQITKLHTGFLFTGLIVLVALLSTMFTIYMNVSEPVPSQPTVLPAQCFSYTTDSDSSRLYTHSHPSSCCRSDESLAAGWYRFTGGGNARLTTAQLTTVSRCGSSYPGWWNGTLPTMSGATTVGNVCFYTGNQCANSISPIIATHCGSFYIFYLISAPCCSAFRYCTSN